MAALKIDELTIPVAYGSVEERREYTAASNRTIDGTLWNNTRYVKRSWSFRTPLLKSTAWSWMRAYFAGLGYDANAEAAYTVGAVHYTVQGSQVDLGAQGSLSTTASTFKGAKSYKLATDAGTPTAVTISTGWESSSPQCVFFASYAGGWQYALIDNNNAGWVGGTWYGSNAKTNMQQGSFSFTSDGVEFKSDSATDYYIDSIRVMPFNLHADMEAVSTGFLATALETLEPSAYYLPWHKVEWFGGTAFEAAVQCTGVSSSYDAAGTLYESYQLEIIEK